MGGANNRSLISAHFCISAYFLTAETYKRMRLTTRVYGSKNGDKGQGSSLLLCVLSLRLFICQTLVIVILIGLLMTKK